MIHVSVMSALFPIPGITSIQHTDARDIVSVVFPFPALRVFSIQNDPV